MKEEYDCEMNYFSFPFQTNSSSTEKPSKHKQQTRVIKKHPIFFLKTNNNTWLIFSEVKPKWGNLTLQQRTEVHHEIQKYEVLYSVRSL